MAADRVRAFVSSKMAELAAERAAVKQVLDELNIDAWVFEDDAGASSRSIHESFREELENSDLYIGVFWKGYGEYTIEEFDLASAKNIDRHIYQKGGDHTPDRDPELNAFLTSLARVKGELTVQYFETTEELREKVKRDAARWQMRAVRKLRESGARMGSSARATDPDLIALRIKVQQFWIDGVLGQAIESGAIDLPKEIRPDLAETSWKTNGIMPGQGGRVLAPDDSFLAVFDEFDRSMAILGRAGSGKTTSALQLTRDLISRSELDPSQPVPVVLSLSAWGTDSATLASWIAKEISAKYQIPSRFVRPWLELGSLVLILDGLDEVRAESRDACVEAINRFAHEFPRTGSSVTCRLQDFEALPTRLRIKGAVVLPPLGTDQIERFLENAGDHVAGLRAALPNDPILSNMARSPLMLSVMTVAYRDRSLADLEHETGTAQQRRAEIFEAYIERAFDRPEAADSFSRDALTAWLSWLAKRMEREDRTVFLIEDLQPDWLTNWKQKATYLLGSALLGGVILGTLGILYRLNPGTDPQKQELFGELIWISGSESVGWFVASAVWVAVVGFADTFQWRSLLPSSDQAAKAGRFVSNLLVFGLAWSAIMLVFTHLAEVPDNRIPVLWSIATTMTIGAAAYCLSRSLSHTIQTQESLRFNGRHALAGAAYGFQVGVVISLIVLYSRNLNDWAQFLAWPLTTTAFGALVTGFIPNVVKGKTVPNQGMRLTAITCLRAGRFAIVITAILVVLCLVRGDEYADPGLIMIWAANSFVSIFICLATWFGALDLGHHYLLRGIIGFTREGPYDFPLFLREASRRQLMHRVGGGFIFAQRPLRDHFASMDLPVPSRDEARSPGRIARRLSRSVVGMSVLAAFGVALLLTGLELGSRAATFFGALALVVGVQWVVIRTSVESALLSAGRSEDTD